MTTMAAGYRPLQDNDNDGSTSMRRGTTMTTGIGMTMGTRMTTGMRTELATPWVVMESS